MIRRSAQILLLTLATILGGAAPLRAADQPESADKLKQRAEASTGGTRARLFVEAARLEIEEANQHFTDGDVDKAHARVKDAVSDAEKGADAARTSGKRLKDTEIDLRKLQRRTEDIRRSLALEDRPALQSMVERLEALRQQLLDKMFGHDSKNKTKTTPPS
jgi:capsule polysaccharide export protein KpsE/RkpR